MLTYVMSLFDFPPPKKFGRPDTIVSFDVSKRRPIFVWGAFWAFYGHGGDVFLVLKIEDR